MNNPRSVKKRGRPQASNRTKLVTFLVGIILSLVGANLAIGSEVSAGVGGTTPPNFKVAFTGDQGISSRAEGVLQLIKDEGAQMALHMGDLGYSESDSSSPDRWNNQLNKVLGPDFPYFATAGNHDVPNWAAYRQHLVDRLNRIDGATCEGEYGVMASCHYQGLFFLLTAPGEIGSGHDVFLRDQLEQDNSVWSVCAWHKNQAAMQVGGKNNTVGWGVYEECRKGGGIIATAHEHSYSRTKTLINANAQTVHPDWSDPNQLLVEPGSSFAFVSGLGGQSIRNQDRCLPTTYPYGCNGEWASIYTSDQGARNGALFITFNVDGQPNKARGYFKNVNGEVIDTFEITSGFLFDDTPPTAPDGLTGAAASDSQIDLSWNAASDPDSDIASYNVYRDGQPAGNVAGTSFTDGGLIEDTGYSYTVAAVNGGGMEGPQSAAFNVSTLPDTTPPSIESVAAEGDSTKVEVFFDELLDQASAETAANYQIDHGINVSAAALQPDGRTVHLTTSDMVEEVQYTLMVQNVKDQANSPNAIGNEQYSFSYIDLDPSLVGYWTFDDASGPVAKDSTKYGNHGSLKGNPVWSNGPFDGALDFDGNGDAVQVSASSTLNNLDAFTISMWFYADTTGQSKLGRFYQKSGAFDVRFSNYDSKIYVEAMRWGSKGQWRYTVANGNLLSGWYHLAIAYDYSSSGNEPAVYLNGLRIFDVEQLDSAGGSLSGDAGDVFIGNKSSLSGSFDGRLDDVRLYSGVLGDAEVSTLADGGSPDPAPAPTPTPTPTPEPTPEPTPT
ncbi:MAG: LamG-like jellyroll fold domain-containing protein, partial [Dehalococcoidia bacterium]